MSEYAYTPDNAEREEALFLGMPAPDHMIFDLQAYALDLLTDEPKTGVRQRTYQDQITGSRLQVITENYEDVDSADPWVIISLGSEGDSDNVLLSFNHNNKLLKTDGIKTSAYKRRVQLIDDLLAQVVLDDNSRAILKTLRVMKIKKSIDTALFLDSEGRHIADLARGCLLGSTETTDYVRQEYVRDIGEKLTLHLVRNEMISVDGMAPDELPGRLDIVLDDKQSGIKYSYSLSQNGEKTVLVTTSKDEHADAFEFIPEDDDTEELISLFEDLYESLVDSVPREKHIAVLNRALARAASIEFGRPN